MTRFHLTVQHYHRAGRKRFLRVSELVFVDRTPKAILEWIDLGGVRTPLYLCELDPAKLRRVRGTRHAYRYEEETVDPRYVDARNRGSHAR